MKIRTDFVTNSSSSSFILAFNNKEEGIETIAHLTHKFGSDYVDQLLTDFTDAEAITASEILGHCREEFEVDASYEVDSTPWRYGQETFRSEWMKSHPGASSEDFYNSEERRLKIAERVESYGKALLESIAGRAYLVEIKYSDRTPVGSALEHDILPDMDFTAWQFDHH